jgi:hypothetical protein
MENAFAVAMPGLFEMVLLLAVVVVPIAVLFAIVFFAVKLGTRGRGAEREPPRRGDSGEP